MLKFVMIAELASICFLTCIKVFAFALTTFLHSKLHPNGVKKHWNKV